LGEPQLSKMLTMGGYPQKENGRFFQTNKQTNKKPTCSWEKELQALLLENPATEKPACCISPLAK
jgi:hypothetical protein